MQQKPRTKKLISLITLLPGAVLLFWTGCKERQVQYKKISVDQIYSIEVPEEFQSTQKLSRDAPLQLALDHEEVFALGLFSDQNTLDKESPDNDLQDHFYFHMDNLELNLDNPEIMGPDTLMMDSLMGIQGTLKGQFKGQSVTYLLTILEGEDYLYQFLFWTSSPHWEKYKPVFDRMLESFQLLARHNEGQQSDPPLQPSTQDKTRQQPQQ